MASDDNEASEKERLLISAADEGRKDNQVFV